MVIPVLLVSQSDGLTLKGAVDAGPVNAALFRDPSRGYQGADTDHRALMYAPTALDQGSSVSHWDTSAFPNLLMEPNINPDLTHSLDLTVSALRDIDWFADGGTTDAAPPKSGCTSASGPPSPWLALLGLLALVRRRRPG